jgi:2',3'-cyclic-nucleotide 2'-phosphodiesterase/3'-nucleotidase
VRDPLGEAKKWTAVLRERERVDLVIIAMHMGLEADLQTGEASPGQMPNENAAFAIARQVPGVDVILMGHTHREVPSLYVNGVLLAQSDKWGRSVARVDLYLEKKSGSGRWRVVGKSGRTIPVGDQVDADPEIIHIAEPYHRETQAWLDQVIGDSPVELRAGEERFGDAAILDLVHRVQLEAGNADVSMAMSLNPKARIPKGPVTVRNIIGLYEYEAAPIVIEVTGKQLKEALEHSARHFGTYKPNTPIAELIDERFPAYTYDVAEGIDYELDISRPVGKRIQNMRFRGKPVEPAQKLRLATITFRVNGGAGYTMFKDAPVISRSSKELRELIIDWIKRNGRVPVTATNNWRLLPETLR